MSMLLAPASMRITCGPDKDNKVKKIKTNLNIVKDTDKQVKYHMLTRLAGTDKLIRVEVTWHKKDWKLSIEVAPTDPMLLQMRKLCYDEHFRADNYSLRISVDDAKCKMVHIKADFLASKNSPRQQMAFRYSYTTENLPSFWRQSIWYMDYFVVRPLLRYSSDYWYSNMTSYRNMTQWNYAATFNGTAYLQILLTSNDTVTYKIIAPSETWVWEKIKANRYRNSFQIGTRHFPLVYRLYWLRNKGN